jgi:hypothetical protein
VQVTMPAPRRFVTLALSAATSNETLLPSLVCPV